MTDDGKELRRGWTTGACAAAAAKAATMALIHGEFPDLVEITLPGGQRPGFVLAEQQLGAGFARATIIKDAGDDPDVTHGAAISATIRCHVAGSEIRYLAGPGVGTITRAGLPLPPGEPAINPMPRIMIAQAIRDVAAEGGFDVEISVADGEALAAKTLNPRLGIMGGISILGTTGIVIPFSCSAWIHSIWRGIDVARAAGLDHVLGATGNASEQAGQALYDLPEIALIDMGDFVGGMLKYLKKHPVAKVTIAGGVAKMTKLAQGMLDVHSKRGLADLDALAQLAQEAGAKNELTAAIRNANNVAHAFTLANEARFDIGSEVARRAWSTAAKALNHPDIALEVIVFDRNGQMHGRSGFRPSSHCDEPSQP